MSETGDGVVAGAPGEAGPAFRTLDAFVNEFLVEAYARQVVDQHSRAWCPEWWHHVEAYTRLEALWKAYEHLRRDPRMGLSRWWIKHADRHMLTLFDPQGPFKYCSVRGGHKSMLPDLLVSDYVQPGWRDIPQLTFESLNDFVNVWISRAYARQVTDVNSTVWCPEWSKHREAVERLRAMWQAFDHLRKYSTGLSIWWTEHGDVHMHKLFDPQGTFRYCSVRNGHRDMLPRLAAHMPTTAMFDQPSEEKLQQLRRRD